VTAIRRPDNGYDYIDGAHPLDFKDNFTNLEIAAVDLIHAMRGEFVMEGSTSDLMRVIEMGKGDESQLGTISELAPLFLRMGWISPECETDDNRNHLGTYILWDVIPSLDAYRMNTDLMVDNVRSFPRLAEIYGDEVVSKYFAYGLHGAVLEGALENGIDFDLIKSL